VLVGLKYILELASKQHEGSMRGSERSMSARGDQ
jgi:hypothetical protein